MKVAALPTFYQSVTDILMILAQTAEEKPDLQPVQPISCEDSNVSRYAAGYVFQEVYKKIRKSR